MKCQCGLLTDLASTCNDCVSAIKRKLEAAQAGEANARDNFSRATAHAKELTAQVEGLREDAAEHAEINAAFAGQVDELKAEAERLKRLYEAVKEERDKIQMDAISANLQIKKLKEEVEHWVFARKSALAGGDILKAEVDKKTLELEAVSSVAANRESVTHNLEIKLAGVTEELRVVNLQVEPLKAVAEAAKAAIGCCDYGCRQPSGCDHKNCCPLDVAVIEALKVIGYTENQKQETLPRPRCGGCGAYLIDMRCVECNGVGEPVAEKRVDTFFVCQHDVPKANHCRRCAGTKED